MINILNLIKYYTDRGYSLTHARAKVAQDILLTKISKSNYNDNVTIKGGVVMFNLTNNIRRATIDIDISFIKYSLNDKAIRTFFENLITSNDGIILKVVDIKELKHLDYQGKRVLITLTDAYNYTIQIKFDIGVHTYNKIKQDNIVFNIETIGDKVFLNVNSKKQIFCEKMISILRHGIRTTRIKDFYDLYYLIKYGDMDILVVNEYFNILKFYDYTKDDKLLSIYDKTVIVLSNSRILNQLKNEKNWLDITADELKTTLLEFLKSLT